MTTGVHEGGALLSTAFLDDPDSLSDDDLMTKSASAAPRRSVGDYLPANDK